MEQQIEPIASNNNMIGCIYCGILFSNDKSLRQHERCYHLKCWGASLGRLDSRYIPPDEGLTQCACGIFLDDDTCDKVSHLRGDYHMTRVSASIDSMQLGQHERYEYEEEGDEHDDEDAEAEVDEERAEEVEGNPLDEDHEDNHSNPSDEVSYEDGDKDEDEGDHDKEDEDEDEEEEDEEEDACGVDPHGTIHCFFSQGFDDDAFDPDDDGYPNVQSSATSSHSMASTSSEDWMAPFRDDKLAFGDDALIGTVWLLPWDTDSEESIVQKMRYVHRYARYRIVRLRHEVEVGSYMEL